MSDDFAVVGRNPDAPFTLKIHRGDGMVLLGMNWKGGKKPPADFVGFAIEFRAPGAQKFFALHNRLTFPGADAGDPKAHSSLRAPIQKFRWVHFPFNAELAGAFTYRVTPAFMNDADTLRYGEAQTADVVLARETYPGKLNIAFSRGFVSSQAFVDRYESRGPVNTLVPTTDAKFGLDFTPTHRDKTKALRWMGFEARSAILELLDEAVADETVSVQVVAYDLNQPEIVDRLKKLGARLRIIVDDSDAHGESDSAEAKAVQILAGSAGATNVKRQHLGGLQHNKTIVVSGPDVAKVACGSTNFTWRGLYVQNNNAAVLTGAAAVRAFSAAFESYWANDKAAAFAKTSTAPWTDLELPGIDAQVSFSPHTSSTALLAAIGKDIADNTTSSLLYSLAFLGKTTGAIRDAVTEVTERDDRFVYGIADSKVGGIKIQKPDGNVQPVSPTALSGQVPPPFKVEPTGGSGVRMHHKFVVIDFDKPTARVYLGSYNFSPAADRSNGENLLLIRDRRVAVSYMVEALRLFDHYHFRAKQTAASATTELVLRRPPRTAGEKPWWDEHFTNGQKVRDRKLFS
jgi:phosphatidylserine/phosphatidylglycerophosphate/cardiolipin synthase-like enzyme